MDGIYSGLGWLSNNKANNPDPDFYYELIFNSPGRSVGGVTFIWNYQATYCDVPAAWEIQVVQGTVTNSLGTFVRTTSPNGVINAQYHVDFGRVFPGVTKLRLVAPEANVSGTVGVGLTEIEALANCAHPTPVTDFNLARLATRKSLLPFVAATQGSTNGLCDGRLNDGWMVNPPFENDNGYIVNSTNRLQPYLTWDTKQWVRSLRLWNDNLSGYGRACPWDRIMVDTLSGPPSGADTESNWANQYDSGPGLNTYYGDVDLGSAIETHGVRVRVFRTANDINVGEIAVYGPRFVGVPPQRLIDSRNSPDGIAVSSTFARNANLATNMDYNASGWLSAVAANNPGSEYVCELLYNSPGKSVGGISLIWNIQSPYCDIPSTWELQLVQETVTNSLGWFSRELGRPGAYRLAYHYDLGQVWTNVTKVRLVVPEVNVAGGLGIGLTEFESYSNRAGYLAGTFFYFK